MRELQNIVTMELQQKDTFVRIRQTLLSVKVQITTNEITSNTIVANLVEENEEYILYYTYITNPKSKYSKENPIQHGTCRLMLSNKDCLTGSYWTSRQTIGDIELKRKYMQKYILNLHYFIKCMKN